MIKYYKFKMKVLFQDETEDDQSYYPKGIVSLLNYDQLIYQNRITIMWKSPNGVAYESTLNIQDVDLEECTVDQYKRESDDIDYVHNNNIQKMLDGAMFSTATVKKPVLSIVKGSKDEST